MLDLHECSAAVACTVLSCHLQDLRATPPQADLVVVTGKGLGSGDEGPVLKRATRAHLAEIGASAHQIGAWTGHASLSEVSHYTRAADKKVILLGAEQERNAENSIEKFPDRSEK